jgi:hypothetical protein
MTFTISTIWFVIGFFSFFIIPEKNKDLSSQLTHFFVMLLFGPALLLMEFFDLKKRNEKLEEELKIKEKELAEKERDEDDD